MSDATDDLLRDAAHHLLGAAPIRARAEQVVAHVAAGHSDHWAIDRNNLSVAVDLVARVTEEAYGDPRHIPYHGRLRHFTPDGVGRVGVLRDRLTQEERLSDARAWSRVLIDLIVVSVLLDAGAGPDWSFDEEATGRTWTRSEGLAIASLRMFEDGVFSTHDDDPYRVDAAALQQVDAEALAQGFQVDPNANPLVGLDERAALLRHLGAEMLRREDLFDADAPRPADLLERFAPEDTAPQAPQIFQTLLDVCGPIWPSAHTLGGVSLGDVWPCAIVRRHPKGPDDPSDGWMPFHKLTLWLTYSLLEPVELLGAPVEGLHHLPALAEYRNGGLLVDTGVLTLKTPEDAERTHATGSALVVEWRALTISLIDAIHRALLTHWDMTREQLPLVKALQGGTWQAGRVIAAQKRGGTPPLEIERDGTVF